DQQLPPAVRGQARAAAARGLSTRTPPPPSAGLPAPHSHRGSSSRGRDLPGALRRSMRGCTKGAPRVPTPVRGTRILPPALLRAAVGHRPDRRVPGPAPAPGRLFLQRSTGTARVRPSASGESCMPVRLPSPSRTLLLIAALLSTPAALARQADSVYVRAGRMLDVESGRLLEDHALLAEGG